MKMMISNDYAHFWRVCGIAVGIPKLSGKGRKLIISYTVGIISSVVGISSYRLLVWHGRHRCADTLAVGGGGGRSASR